MNKRDRGQEIVNALVSIIFTAVSVLFFAFLMILLSQ